MPKFYCDLNTKEKKNVREVLDRIAEFRKQEKKLIMDNIIKPLEEGINLKKRIINNEIPLEHIKRINDTITKQVGVIIK